MPLYTLKPGQACGHNGRELKVGEVVELPVHIGREVAEKLMPCTEDGTSLLHLSAEELAFEQAAGHEKDSLRAAAEKSAKARKAAAALVNKGPTSGASSEPKT